MHYKPTWRYAAGWALVGALMLAALLPNPAAANVYATKLEASGVAFAPGAGHTITFSFILNESADNGVVLKVYRAVGDQLVRTADLGPLPKGAQSWAWDGKDDGGTLVPLGQSYYFTVTASDDGYSEWTQISVDADRNKFYSPRGVSVNTDPASRYYGRIYVSEAVASGANSWTGSPMTRQDGIYMLNADSTDAVGQGDSARTGGVAWLTNSSASPWRCFVGPDDQVYVCDWSDPHAGLWVGDPDFVSAQAILDPAGASAVGLTANHGSIPAAMVEGVGVNRVLYTMDEDYPRSAAVLGSIWQYNIGNRDLPWTSPPDARPYNDDFPINRILNYTNDFARDNAGNWIITQDRSDGTDYASVIRVAPDGTLLRHSLNDFGGRDPLRQTRAMAFDRIRNRTAFGTYNVGRINILDQSIDVEAMQVIVSVGMWAVGDGGAIATSGDRGKTWIAAASPTTENLKCVHLASTWTGYAVGANGAVVKTTDRGLTWTAMASPGAVELRAVKAPTAAIVYAAGAGGSIFKSTDGGATWASQVSGTSNAINSLDLGYASSNLVYACGDGGTILKTNDGGAGWSVMPSGTTANLNCISIVRDKAGADFGWAVGDGGTILRTVDSGANWTAQVVAGVSANLKSVVATSGRIGRVVADNGAVLRTKDGGATWTVVNPGPGALHACSFIDAANGWAVGANGRAIVTANGGATWTAQAAGVSANLNSIFAREVTEPNQTSSATWRDLEFDAAGNLYAVDNMLENLRVYSPPDGPNSSTTKSFGVVAVTSGDVTPPSTPVVTDDGSMTLNHKQLHATWTAATDAESGVAEYAYAIGGTPTDIGRAYVVGWTSVGAATQVTATGLNLIGGKYFFYVKARNGAGIWGDVGVSNGILVIPGKEIGEVKKDGIGSVIGLKGVVVTEQMGDFSLDPPYTNLFHVQEPDRSAGVMVYTAGELPEKDTVVDIIGAVRKGVRGATRVPTDDTVYIEATSITPTGDPNAAVAPVAMNTLALGGTTTGLQPGATGASGVNTVGLLTTICGHVMNSGLTYEGVYYVYLDDGARVACDMDGVTGVKCYLPFLVPVPFGFATATGVSGVEYFDPTPGAPGDEQMIRTLWVRELF